VAIIHRAGQGSVAIPAGLQGSGRRKGLVFTTAVDKAQQNPPKLGALCHRKSPAVDEDNAPAMARAL